MAVYWVETMKNAGIKVFKDACRNSGLNTDISQLFSYIHEFEDKREGEQLSLMDFMVG